MITKFVTDNHYHIWTDALHMRQLARQTSNIWDRGTYVRLTIISAWSCFETACHDAVNDNVKHWRSFWDDLNKLLVLNDLPKIDVGRGVWQEINKIHIQRKKFAHRVVPTSDLFPELEFAENAIKIVRNSINAIYQHCQKQVPDWIDDDGDIGWTTGLWQLHATSREVKPWDDDPNAINVKYIYENQEYPYDTFPPDTDLSQPLKNLFKGIGKPITAIRVYKGSELVDEQLFEASRVRGAIR